jgi:hypothetical protein
LTAINFRLHELQSDGFGDLARAEVAEHGVLNHSPQPGQGFGLRADKLAQGGGDITAVRGRLHQKDKLVHIESIFILPGISIESQFFTPQLQTTNHY